MLFRTSSGRMVKHPTCKSADLQVGGSIPADRPPPAPAGLSTLLNPLFVETIVSTNFCTHF